MPDPTEAAEIPLKRPPRRWLRWVRIVGGIGLLAVLLSRADFHDLTVRFTGALAVGGATAIACLALAQGLSALRWRVLLGPDAAPWSFLYRLYLIAAFFSLFLPTAIGGDAIRAAAASRSLGRTSRMVATVLADRMLGVFALAVFVVIGLVVAGGGASLGLAWRPRPWMAWAALGALFGLGLGVYLARRRLTRLLAFVGEGLATFRDLARDPGRLALAVLLGFGVQGAYLLAWIALARALGLGVPTASFLLTVPIVSLSTMAPITLSGVGVREGTWILLLRPYGIGSADALALSLTYFACWMLVAAMGGVLFAVRGLEPSRPGPGRPSEGVPAGPGARSAP
jgi:glycosyltransferase 2 family protein